MNASADMSILSLLTHASVVVQAVLAILIILSLISWTRIFQKFFQLRQAKQLSEDFESRFWSGAELNKLYEHAQNHREHSGTQERIFASGMTEFLKRPEVLPKPWMVSVAPCVPPINVKWIALKAAYPL